MSIPYLDKPGLTYLWSKIKALVANHKHSPVSACTAGDYYAQNTVIPLTVILSDYSKLLFVCGADNATDGIQTIIVPLHTGKTYHRLMWFSGDGKLRFSSESHKYLVISINETANTVSIVASGVASNGISQILAS